MFKTQRKGLGPRKHSQKTKWNINQIRRSLIRKWSKRWSHIADNRTNRKISNRKHANQRVNWKVDRKSKERRDRQRIHGG